MSHLTISRMTARFPSRRKLSRLLLTLLLIAIASWLLFRALSTANASPAPTSLEQPIATQAQPAALASAGRPDFSTQRAFGPPNDRTYSVSMGDMNGDDALDIVVGNHGQSVVYLNDGLGHFYDTSPYTRPFGTGMEDTRSVAVGDMNGDGYLDIVAGDSYSQSVVYLNNGTGDFYAGTVNCAAPPTNVRCFGTGMDDTRSVAVGDMNGDGALDIVVGNHGGQNVVYLNNGGCFTDTRLVGTGTYSTTSVAVGDMDGDGALDIVVGNGDLYSGAQNVVYLNDGRGDFSAHAFGTGADTTTSVAVGDMDGNGTLDIVVGAWQQRKVVYLNDGTGIFYAGPVDCTAPPGNVRCLGIGTGLGLGADDTNSIALGDMNGDGALDVVVGNDGQNVVYLNVGWGSFYTGVVNCDTPPTNLLCVGPVWKTTMSVAVGDIHGDGALDIVAGNGGYYGGQSIVYLNDGSGSLVYTRAFGPNTDDTHSVAVGDMDGDGALDIVVGNDGQNVVYLNDGAGNFAGAVNCVAPSANARCFGTGTDNTQSVAVGDMDGDDALDIVVGNHGQSVVYLNDGLGHFYNTSPYTRPFGTGIEDTRSVAVGDMNGDGYLDIVAGDSYSQSVVYLNNGTGDFYAGTVNCVAPPTNVRCFGAGMDDIQSVAVGDMNGDGELDIVVGNWNQHSMVYLNDGAGNFYAGTVNCAAPPGNVRCFEWEANSTTSVAVGDMDNDGALDIVVGNGSQQNAVYLNDGRGNFANTEAYVRYFGTGADHTNSVAVGDMNGDGALDIVLGNFRLESMVCLNDGTGNFAAMRAIGENETNSVAVGDMNGDGALDILTGNFNGGSSQNVVYLNGLAGLARLANNPPRVALTRPNPLVNANFVYSNPALRSPTIPITYTLFDREGEPVRAVRAYYSPDGGGKWYTAAAASDTITTNLFTLGDALNFDGVYAYVQVPDSASLNAADELTLQAWVKLTNPTTDQKIIGKTPIGSGYLLGVAEGVLYPEIWDSNGARYWFKAGNILPDQWTHLAVTWKTGGQMIGYVNGVPIQTIAASANPIGLNSTALRIGCAPSGWPDPFAVTGQIDEVRVYNRALSADEIRNTMIKTLTSATPGLVGYWRLNEGRGYTAFDQTPNHNNGILNGPPTWTEAAFPYVYNWDVFASGFFGQSDDVVFRIEAYPTQSPTVDGSPGPYQRPYLSAQTFPFRVRGTQVRVYSSIAPVSNAIVYRLPYTQTTGAKPISDVAGQPFHTDGQGYLQGRGIINVGDTLVALLPISSTGTYTLYYTSAAPTPTGLNPYTVTASGVQMLTVTSDNPLILFNLDVSLEWDARQDAAYVNQLDFNLQRASEVLYDITNGQAALGNITLYHDRQEWNNAHIRIYADNQLRPFADQGGIVTDPVPDPVTSTVVYVPGQLNMGATWNRYGDAGITLGEDWPRTLAHELGHYLLYQDDDYLGLDASGLLTSTTACTSTIMSDSYRDDYSELRSSTNWLPACASTLSNRSTGRSDWATVSTFYSALKITTNPGPSGLPLAVTQIKSIAPVTPTSALPDPRFYLTLNNARIQPGDHTQAYVFRGDRLINLGRPVVDQLLARGAQPDDRLCVYELEANRLGCKIVAADDNQQLALYSVSNWLPDVRITPVSTQTVQVQVLGLAGGLSLRARFYDDTGYASPTFTLPFTGSIYSETFNLTEPILEASVHLWVDEPDPRREIVTDYALGGNPGNKRSGYGNKRSGYGNKRSGYAPVLSGDGQVILYSTNLNFPPGEFYTFQAATLVPNPPPWATIVSKGYWLSRSANAPALVGPSISMGYAQNQVPPGEESFLRVYFWNGANWTPLTTTLATDDNLAVAPAQGPGLYVLMSSVEIPLYGPGWDAFAYPVQATRLVTQALQSISGAYSTVYWYNGSDKNDPWKVYDTSAPVWANDLGELRFGESYWISLTQAITLHLKGDSALAANGVNALNPPATYYGAVLSGDGFTPTSGMTVTAWINGKWCGQGQTLPADGQVVHTVNVFADGPDGATGCGAPGRKVTFKIGNRSMCPVVAWDNNRLWPVALTTGYRVYLPLIVK